MTRVLCHDEGLVAKKDQMAVKNKPREKVEIWYTNPFCHVLQHEDHLQPTDGRIWSRARD